jgi:hypothetical protein
MKTLKNIAISLGVFFGSFFLAYAGTVVSVGLGGTGASSFSTSNGIVSVGATSLTSYSGYTLTSTGLTAANASTTQLSSGTNTFYVAPSGHTTAKDTVNNWSGVLSPTHSFVVGLATSTTWIATTTSPWDFNAGMTSPWTGTIENAVCSTDVGTVTGVIKVGGTAIKYITGVGTTPATTTVSATINKGAAFQFDAGNPASSPKAVRCTINVVETP